jgi:hypothetical protein
MRPFFLILGVGLLAADIAHAADCPDGSSFDSKVFDLENGYVPVAVGKNAAVTPSCTQSNGNAATVRNAFLLAPDLLKAELCNLKCVAVSTGGGTWGKWANNNFKGNGANGKGDDSKVIGVDTNGLNNMSDLNITLAQKLDNNLIGLSGKHTVASGADSKELGLMYTLAHEMAHIKWHRDFKNGISAGCTQDDFIKKSWQGHVGSTVRRWTHFGEEFGDHKNPGGTNIPFPSEVASDTDISNIYNVGGFATALGATNPEEDFVEAYAVGAIIAANKSSLSNIQINLKLNSGTPIPVFDPNFRNGNALLTFKIKTCALPLLDSTMGGAGLDGGYGHRRGDGRKKRR